jgi:preprotein translocase SecE subunit
MAKLNVTVDNKLEEFNIKKSKKNIKKANKVFNDKNSNKKQTNLDKIINEMKLVTWSPKKDIIKYSVTTILMIVILALFFVTLSAGFDLLYRLVRGWIG